MLVDAVIIAGDGPGPDVDSLSHLRVPDIGEVIDLGSGPDDGVLDLDKVSDVGRLMDLGSGTEVREGTEDRPVPHPGPGQKAKPTDLDLVSDLAVDDPGIGPDHASGSDAGFSFKIAAGVEGGVRADGDVHPDIGPGGIEQGDTVPHMTEVDPFSQDGLGLGHLVPGVDPHDLVGVRACQARNLLVFILGDLDQVGEVVFVLNVAVGQRGDGGSEKPGVKAVDSRVDLPDGFLLLRGVLFLNDLQDVPRVGSDDTAVSGR